MKRISIVTSPKKITRMTVLSLALLLLIFSCGGCGAKNLSFPDFLKDGYFFPGTEWGMSADQVQEALGISLTASGGETRDEEGNQHQFYQGDNLRVCDLGGNSTFQFRNDRLWAVGISCPVEKDGNEKYEQLVKEAQEVYGTEQEAIIDKAQPDVDGSSTSGLSATIYRWEKTNSENASTALMLSCIKQEGTVTHISVDVNIFPIPDEY